MNVLVATDGSKYGQWGLNWVAKLPLVGATTGNSAACAR